MVYVKPSRDVLQPKRNLTLHFKPNSTTRIYPSFHDMMGMVISASGQVVLDCKNSRKRDLISSLGSDPRIRKKIRQSLFYSLEWSIQ